MQLARPTSDVLTVKLPAGVGCFHTGGGINLAQLFGWELVREAVPLDMPVLLCCQGNI